MDLGLQPGSGEPVCVQPPESAPDLRKRCNFDNAWAQRDSNPRPLPCKGSALPTELCARRRTNPTRGSIGVGKVLMSMKRACPDTVGWCPRPSVVSAQQQDEAVDVEIRLANDRSQRSRCQLAMHRNDHGQSGLRSKLDVTSTWAHLHETGATQRRHRSVAGDLRQRWAHTATSSGTMIGDSFTTISDSSSK